jgi:hypothetical protein
MNTGIAVFVTEKMSAYIAGGMKPETAARFTRGELGAIYKNDHWSRDTAVDSAVLLRKNRGERHGETV